MDDYDKQAVDLGGIVRGLPSSPKKGDIVTRGSIRRAFARLAKRGDERDLERTQDELLFACDNVARAYGQYARLFTNDAEITGTFRSHPYGLGIQFLYRSAGHVQAIAYSPEDVTMKGVTREGKTKVYLFEERYRELGRGPGLQGLDAFVAKFILWRAGV